MKGISVTLAELIALRKWATHPLPHHAQNAQPLGTLPKIRKGRGMSFAETRHYQAGDDIRHMAWRITARTGRPHVKIYQEEQDRAVLLIVDFNPSMFFGTRGAFKSTRAAQLAALLAWRAHAQHDKIGGFLFASTQQHAFPPKSAMHHLMRFLKQLVGYSQAFPASPPPAPTRLNTLLQQIRAVNKPGSLIVLMSDFYTLDASCAPLLNQLSQHNDVWAVHVYDPLEHTPPPPGRYPISDGLRTHCLDTTDPHLRQTLQQAWQDHHHAIQQHCRRHRLHYVPLSTDTDLLQTAFHLLPSHAHAR